MKKWQIHSKTVKNMKSKIFLIKEYGNNYQIINYDSLKVNFRGGGTEYLIKWLGYDDRADCTWEPVENLGDLNSNIN